MLLVVANQALEISGVRLFIFPTKDARLILLLRLDFEIYRDFVLGLLCSVESVHRVRVAIGAILLCGILSLHPLPFLFNLVEE